MREEKAQATGKYRARVGCDVYIPVKQECGALREMLCVERGDCPFYKTKEQARSARIDSARRRKEKGLILPEADERLLESAGAGSA